MDEQQEKELVEYAKAWLTRTHIGRTSAEKDAYIEGVQDVLAALFQNTAKGMKAANKAYDVLDEIMYA